MAANLPPITGKPATTSEAQTVYDLPDEVIAQTSAKYREAYERVTGRTLG